jgi:hypothetical protein
LREELLTTHPAPQVRDWCAQLKAGMSPNTIDVQSTAAGIPVTITMGNGGNTINVGSSSNTLDGLLAALNVTGGTGANTLNLNDQGSSAAQTYTIAATTVNRSGAAGITYSKMKKLVLRASSGTDTITIVNTATSTPVTVTGAGGATTLVGPNVTNTWTLTGANSGTVSNVTFSGVSNLVGGSGTDTFKFNAPAVFRARSTAVAAPTNWTIRRTAAP